MARPNNDRNRLVCPYCGKPSRKTVCALPIGITASSLVEVWYCMDCTKRAIIVTYLADDFVQVMHFQPCGWFGKLPPPWSLPKSEG